jgi:hypothetical protein
MIYLASPYTHKDKSVMQWRFEQTRELTIKLMRDYPFVYSPVVYCHPLAVKYDLPIDALYWKQFDTEFIRKCNRMIVHTLDGWKESVGVQMEIELAARLFIPIDCMS